VLCESWHPRSPTRPEDRASGVSAGADYYEGEVTDDEGNLVGRLTAGWLTHT